MKELEEILINKIRASHDKHIQDHINFLKYGGEGTKNNPQGFNYLFHEKRD